MSFLQRCSYCEDKGKVITFSIHQMLYHMFYSSMDYSEPDVVIIYGNTDEMSSSDVEDIHTDMSYRNMSSSRDTVLILTDVNKDRLRQGVKAVNAARPMKQLVAPHMNPFFGFTTKRADIDSDTAVINEKITLHVLGESKCFISYICYKYGFSIEDLLMLFCSTYQNSPPFRYFYKCIYIYIFR